MNKAALKVFLIIIILTLAISSIMLIDCAPPLTTTSSSSSSLNTITGVIDSSGDTGYASKILLDKNNNVYIFYEASTDQALKYATNVSGSWGISTIDTGITGPNSANVEYLRISMIFDSLGNFHVSYYDGTNLKYATNALGSWTVEKLDSSTAGGLCSSIRIDNNNKPHISYFGNINKLRYIDKSSDFWNVQSLDSTSATLYMCSMLMNNNKSYIIYFNNTSNTLKIITDKNGSWDTPPIPTIDSNTAVGMHLSSAFDSNLFIHASYYDSTNKKLKYANNLYGWLNETLLDPTSDDVGKFSSIAIDNSNHVHISYYNATNGDLKYATNANGSWTFTTLDSTYDVGKYSSIAVDSSNRKYVSYYDATNKCLKYISWQ